MNNPIFSFNSMRGRNNLSIGSLAEIKFIITSVVVPQSTSKFAALIKNANDSETFDTSLENKSIGAKIDVNKIHQDDVSAVDASVNTNSDIINTNNENDEISGNTYVSGEYHSVETIPMDTSNDSYTDLKGSVTSSTPVKWMGDGYESETYKLNLHTPPKDASFIDSDHEPNEQDESNTPQAIVLYDVLDNETLKYTYDNGSTTPKEFSFKKPIQSTLRRHKKMLKEAKVLKFFTNRRRKKSRLQYYEKRSSNYDSDSSRSTSPMSKCNELGCTPLLVTENVQRFCDNAEWGDDFDFSFICEPSTSDLENDDENMDANLNSMNISTYNFQPACVPTFRITAPGDSQNFKEASVHVLRRSLSNPNSMCDLLNKSSDMTYENFVEAVVRLEGTTSHCASVRNLDTLTVSFSRNLSQLKKVICVV